MITQIVKCHQPVIEVVDINSASMATSNIYIARRQQKHTSQHYMLVEISGSFTWTLLYSKQSKSMGFASHCSIKNAVAFALEQNLDVFQFGNKKELAYFLLEQ